MKGVLIISHGKMAEGVQDSLEIFFGRKLEQVDHLGLNPSEGPDEFFEILKRKISELDTGEGVIIFADLFGGTPSNLASMLVNENVHLLSGFNLAMILEHLALRSNEFDPENLVTLTRNGIVYVNAELKKKKVGGENDY